MEWIVEGASAESGEELKLTLEANDAEQAERRGRRRGILVSSVRPLELEPQLEPQSDLERGPEVETEAAEPADLLQSAVASVDYATPTALNPQRARRTVPNYTGLQIGSGVLRVLGLLCYALGAVTILLGVAALIVGLTQGSSGGTGGTVAMLMAFIGSLSPLIAGAILHMLGSAGVALRDIARNSFR